MIKSFLKIFLFISFSQPIVLAADVSKLKDLFVQNFDNYYEPRYCGKNIVRFVSRAVEEKIDLSNSYVLEIVGAGFLETSGFYAREAVDQRTMLGYFHVVFVADDYVFDFDLHRPVVLKLEEYVRLQLTPPFEPFNVFGIKYRSLEQLSGWTAIAFDWSGHIQKKVIELWRKKFPEFINLERMLEIDRNKLK